MTTNVGIVEREEAVIASIARQEHDNHVSAATYVDPTIEDAVLSVRTFVATVL
jgi:hypothetical protein